MLLRCLGEVEAYVAILQVHSGSCGAHQAGQKMRWLLVRQGVYWSTMLKNCIEYTKSSHECKKYANIQCVSASELHSIIKPWPLRGCVLDLIGEINPASSKGHKYIIVDIDYFTKWLEAITLKSVTMDNVIDFIQNHVV